MIGGRRPLIRIIVTIFVGSKSLRGQVLGDQIKGILYADNFQMQIYLHKRSSTLTLKGVLLANLSLPKIRFCLGHCPVEHYARQNQESMLHEGRRNMVVPGNIQVDIRNSTRWDSFIGIAYDDSVYL